MAATAAMAAEVTAAGAMAAEAAITAADATAAEAAITEVAAAAVASAFGLAAAAAAEAVAEAIGAGALVGWSGATNVPAICVRARLDHFFSSAAHVGASRELACELNGVLFAT